MVRLNAPAPDFALDGIANGQARRVRLSDFRGRWVVLFFYPADFTFVCPTEIHGFQARRPEFTRRDCDILGVSVDNVESHRAWAVELGGVEFPLLSDPEDPQHEPGRDDEGVHDDDVLDGGPGDGARTLAPGNGRPKDTPAAAPCRRSPLGQAQARRPGRSCASSRPPPKPSPTRR